MRVLIHINSYAVSPVLVKIKTQQLKLLSQNLFYVNFYKAKENCLSEMLHTLGIEFTHDSKSAASIILAKQNDFCGNKH